MRDVLREVHNRLGVSRSFSICFVAAILTAAALVQSSAAAEPSVESLTGYGKASFGASVDEVKALWPDMQTVAPDTQLPSAAFVSPHLGRFLLKGEQIPGLSKPVDVELRFWEGKLWAYLVYFDKADKAAALQYLEKTYGMRTSGIEDRPIWGGEKVTLQAVGEAGWFGATDNALSDQARAWFFTALTGNPEGNKPPDVAPTPLGAAPVPAAPAAATPGS